MRVASNANDRDGEASSSQLPCCLIAVHDRHASDEEIIETGEETKKNKKKKEKEEEEEKGKEKKNS